MTMWPRSEGEHIQPLWTILLEGKQRVDLTLHLGHEVLVEWRDLVLIEPILEPGLLPGHDVESEG